MAAHSPEQGPVVWLTACGHGDEVGGIVIIQDIFKRIRRTGLLRGSIYAFPLMNPIGFESISRHITLSKEDLNRSFPGNKNGTFGERIADQIFTKITETQPTLVLDLHNDWIQSIPYTLIDKDSSSYPEEMGQEIRFFAVETGFLVIQDTEELSKTLSHNLIVQGIPALTLELGESYVVNEANIDFGVKSIWNILSSLEMVEAAEQDFRFPFPEHYRGQVLRYSDRPLSSTSGIIRYLAKPGDFVVHGQPIAKTYNAFGKRQEILYALDNGIVLGHADSSMVFPGMRVMAFGLCGQNLCQAQ